MDVRMTTSTQPTGCRYAELECDRGVYLFSERGMGMSDACGECSGVHHQHQTSDHEDRTKCTPCVRTETVFTQQACWPAQFSDLAVAVRGFTNALIKVIVHDVMFKHKENIIKPVLAAAAESESGIVCV